MLSNRLDLIWIGLHQLDDIRVILAPPSGQLQLDQDRIHPLPAEIAIFLDRLISLAEPVQTYYRWRPQLRDPGDEMVLEAAVNGQAGAIVTFNEKDLRAARSSFGIEVLRPGEVLQRLIP